MRRKIWKKRKVIIMAAVLLLLAGCSKEAEKEQVQLAEVKEDTSQDAETEDTEEKQEAIYVHVCGEVVNPGVYRLHTGSRIYEAVEAAGGLSDEASAQALNQAEQIEDGQQIYVPSREEKEQQILENQSADPEEDGKVNLNTASKEQLKTLNGIGEAKATAIIQYREEHGGFQKIEELMEVEGIKEGTFQKIMDQIKI